MKNGNDNTNTKALKAGFGYTIGNILIRGISFLSAFIFARLLTVSDYGIYNTFSAYASIMFVFAGLALHASIKNANIDYKEKINEYCSSIVLLAGFNTLALLLLSALLGSPLSGLLSLEKPILVVFVVLESFGSAMIQFYNCYLSKDYKYKKYLILSLIYSLLGISLSLIFIIYIFPSEKYMGRILGTLISAILITIFIVVDLFKNAKPTINLEFWKYGLKISLPIIPHGLSQVVLSQFDRLMIKKTIGSVEAGIYSFSYTISSIFQVIVNSLDTAWQQWFFDQMEAKNYSLIKKVGSVYAAIVAAGTIALMLITPELVLLMGGTQYSDSRGLALPVLLAMFFSYMYYFPAGVEYFYKKTKFIALGTAVAALLNVILNLIFISLFGYIAAAYTTVVCYLLYFIFHTVLAYKIHGKNIFNLKIQFIILVIVSAMMFLILFMLDNWIFRYLLLLIEIICLLIIAIKNKNMIALVIKNIKK